MISIIIVVVTQAFHVHTLHVAPALVVLTFSTQYSSILHPNKTEAVEIDHVELVVMLLRHYMQCFCHTAFHEL
jgi:hypothetical protein